MKQITNIKITKSMKNWDNYEVSPAENKYKNIFIGLIKYSVFYLRAIIGIIIGTCEQTVA